MGNELTVQQAGSVAMSFDEMEKSASIIAKSKLFPQWDTQEKIMTLMLLCRAEGRDPISAINRYDFISGRVAKKAQAMLEDFLFAGGKVEWKQTTNDVAEATFIPPGGGKALTHSTTMADICKAGLNGKDNYKKYPAAMLRARLISSAMRMIFPSATNLLYTPEEADDFGSPVQQTKPVVVAGGSPLPSANKVAVSQAKPVDAVVVPNTTETSTATATVIEPETTSTEEIAQDTAEKTIEQRIAELPQDKLEAFLVSRFKKKTYAELAQSQKDYIAQKWTAFVEYVNKEKGKDS